MEYSAVSRQGKIAAAKNIITLMTIYFAIWSLIFLTQIKRKTSVPSNNTPTPNGKANTRTRKKPPKNRNIVLSPSSLEVVTVAIQNSNHNRHESLNCKLFCYPPLKPRYIKGNINKNDKVYKGVDVIQKLKCIPVGLSA